MDPIFNGSRKFHTNILVGMLKFYITLFISDCSIMRFLSTFLMTLLMGNLCLARNILRRSLSTSGNYLVFAGPRSMDEKNADRNYYKSNRYLGLSTQPTKHWPTWNHGLLLGIHGNIVYKSVAKLERMNENERNRMIRPLS